MLAYARFPLQTASESCNPDVARSRRPWYHRRLHASQTEHGDDEPAEDVWSRALQETARPESALAVRQ